MEAQICYEVTLLEQWRKEKKRKEKEEKRKEKRKGKASQNKIDRKSVV